jgi:hypothetical protein
MVGPHHRVPEVFQDPHDRIPDDGRAQMADVHFLHHVGRGVVHHHRFGRDGYRHTEAPVSQLARCLAGDPVAGQREVDEAGPADLDPVADAGQVELRHDLLGHLARRHAEALGERKCHVRLEVREV